MNTHTPMIIEALRSPMGRIKADGAFVDLHPTELLAQVLVALVNRTGIDPAEVGDVITGCVSQVGEQSATPGRVAWLAAGYPEHVPSTTIDRKCGSSQQAMAFAAHAVAAGMHDIVIACGVESMSRVQMGSARMGADPFGPSYLRRYGGEQVSQGTAAERVAARWRISREALDQYATRSHHCAHAAARSGQFDNEIVPVSTPAGMITADETIRPGTTAEGLATLKPVFVDDRLSQRFPELGDWRVTAGNSSQKTDGAAAALIMSERAAIRLGLRPRARFVSFDVRGDDPLMMLTAPISSSRKVLEKAGMHIGQMDCFEVNEAFACVPLAWQAELQGDPAKLNPNGGAIALGHPLGASGLRITATMLNWLETHGGRYGLQTMCEAGGMANSMIIERL